MWTYLLPLRTTRLVLATAVTVVVALAFEAEANEVRYDLKTQTLTLTQNAQLKQEESLVKGQMIKYSIDKQEMVAQGDENSRVTTIFLPKQLEEISPKSKPQE